LLIEAIANLVDNAIKYTPAGGQVEIGLLHGNRESIVRVSDTGSGISERERHAVLSRFYRSDKVRHTSGLGLGLNLVAAIVKLHDFRFTIRTGPGCVVEIGCPAAFAPPQKMEARLAECTYPDLIRAIKASFSLRTKLSRSPPERTSQ
jgi:signal transduction histidine kinase